MPDLVRAAREAERAGAHGITVHLREDRRHIQDHDLFRIKKILRTPLNLEMSVVPQIVRIACRLRPGKACLVPEKRRELTTEGGLDVAGKIPAVKRAVSKLSKKGIEVSLFIDPDPGQIRAAEAAGAPVIELHTGTYANAKGRRKRAELARLRRSALLAHALGIQVNAGHGLDYENVRAVAKLPYIHELNIGHSIVSRAVFVGLRQAVREMLRKCATQK